MPQRVSVVRVSLGEGVGYVLDLTAEVLALFDKEGERKTYLILQEILDMRLIERASTGRPFHNAVQISLYTAAIASGHLMTKGNRIQGHFLVDIFLTEEGAEHILTPQDKQPFSVRRNDVQASLSHACVHAHSVRWPGDRSSESAR